MFLISGTEQLGSGWLSGVEARPENRSKPSPVRYPIEQMVNSSRFRVRIRMTSTLQFPHEHDGKACAKKRACQFGSITSQRALRAVPQRTV
jgi:hypothetical protein